jgi:hypothetical protein
MAKTRVNRSAGLGDPYWFEWGIGLLKAVEMLNPDSDIDAVAFQKEGIKGWDDVVIRYRSGRQDYYQVKHSRPRANLTFSDLVGKSNDQPSLLSSLTSSWQEMNLCDTDSSCILITNRNAGTKAGRSSSGVYHPPLAEFVRHISVQLESASALNDISLPQMWKDAWEVWLTEMGSISDNKKLRFLKVLTISVDAPQLEEMRESLSELLCSAFQINDRQASALAQNLLSALLDWTTSLRGKNEWITAEDVMAALSESDPEVFGHCDVPTPIPFFPSREQAVADISSLLIGEGQQRIVFLEAEPGAGKTSVISRIVNQRAQDNSTLVVDLRYYAYKPITPDAPVLPVDADQSASPESLWYTLLSQMRERLRGRLLELRVPVRNNFTKTDEARDHVLRLASLLAKEKGAPFVIVIDGIDHAARAHRKGLPSLLGSMPAPETVPEGVRLLIAGQPASAYPEYPIWLRNRAEIVERVNLGPLDASDIQLLLLHSNTKIPREYHDATARIIQGVAEGNTLAAVFSVAEAETLETLAALEARLSESRLHSGVHEYYSVIWRSAVLNSQAGLGAYLAFALCILGERVTGTMLQKAFPEWCKPIPEWNAILKKLEPLVVCDTEGYRVRHNDLRVFLEQELRTDETSMQRVASLLADYYMGASASPRYRQESLFTLLQLAGREPDKARIFTPSWVLDSAACGRELSTIFQEAEEAFRVIPDAKDWNIALSVTCAGFTLKKLSDCLDAFPNLLDRTSMPRLPLPQCLETERFVPPFNQWDDSSIRRVLSDARMLAERGEINRARGLLKHWFTGVLPAQVVSEVNGITDDRDFGNVTRMAIGAYALFEDWGALTFRLGLPVTIEDPTEDVQQQATYLFEKGWASECVTTSEPKSILSALRAFNPLYLGTFEVAIEVAAKKAMWEVVANLLEAVKNERERMNLEFLIKAAYWALKAKGQDGTKEWIEVLSDVRSGNEGNKAPIAMSLMIFMAKSIGWTEPHRETSAIASELAKVIVGQNRNLRDRSSLLLPLRAAAMIGLIERKLSKGDMEGAAVLVPAPAIRKVIELIWKNRHSLDFHEYRGQALDLTFELIELCQKIGDAHGNMVLSLAISGTEGFPVDQKMPVLWEVLRHAGQRDRLRTWAEHWIGQEGVAWSVLSFSERTEIVVNLSCLCRDEGWIDLADTAEDRLRHNFIGYSSHKEYSFQEPLDWIKELFRCDSNAWREEGIQLLDICRKCDDQGGDNRLGPAIETEVAAAAFRCGPDNAYAFFNEINPEIERYWLQTVRSTLIAAGKRAIADRILTERADILAVWSCAVGLTRWFDKYQAQMVTALRDTILSAADPESRKNLSDSLQALTPGEFLREEYDKDEPDSRSPEEDNTPMASDVDIDYAISELARKKEEGTEVKLMEIGRLALRVVRENPTNRCGLIETLFHLLNTNRGYASSFDCWEGPHPLKELILSIRESERWDLIRAVVRNTGDEFWLLSVPRKVHLICLYRALAEGADCLKKGVQCMFGMHRLWAGFPAHQVTFKQDWSGSSVVTWSGFAATVLYRLLSSNSAETVSAALRGLCAVAEIAPQAVSALFDDRDGVIRSRLLLGAEVWVTLQPLYFTAIIENLWSHRAKLSLEDRIQLWVCILVAAQANGALRLPETFMPQISGKQSYLRTIPILTKPRRLLEIGPNIQGSLRLANAFSSARECISRFGKITGCDTDDIEAEIADGLISRGDETERALGRERKKQFAIEDGDMIITRDVDSIFDEALEHELHKPGWTDQDAGDIAISVMHGDDPWVLRRSPLPSPNSFDWPDQREVNEWLETRIDTANVLSRLRLLAQGGDLAKDQQVLGCYLRVFTSKYDCEIWYWLEVKRPEGGITRSVPLCPSGRSFQFFLPERYEPQAPRRTPLVFFSRSFQCLNFSTLEVVPSRVLQDRLGWHIKPRDPLEWTLEGQSVARYEVYHGPLNYNHSRRHMRQPTLSRWVVKADEIKELGCLTLNWDHEVHPFFDE